MADQLVSDADCAMCRNISMTKNADGTIHVSVTAFGKETALKVAKAIISKFDAKYQVTALREDPPWMTCTCMSEKNKDSNVPIQQAGIFKSIPGEIYDLHQRKLFFKSIVPGTLNPSAARYIKRSDDIYGAEGWTTSEILSAIGANVSPPASLSYHVYQMTIQKGVPLVSVLRSMFPIPGLTISNYDGHLYITLPDSSTGAEVANIVENSGSICDIVHGGESKTTTEFAYKVVGVHGEPKTVEDIDDTEEEDSEGQSEVVLIMNKAGGVFGVKKRTTYSEAVWNIIQPKFYPSTTVNAS